MSVLVILYTGVFFLRIWWVGAQGFRKGGPVASTSPSPSLQGYFATSRAIRTEIVERIGAAVREPRQLRTGGGQGSPVAHRMSAPALWAVGRVGA